MNIHHLNHQFLKFDIHSLNDYIYFIEDNFENFFKEIEKNFNELNAIPENDPIRMSEKNEESYFDYMMGDVSDKHYQHDIFQQRYRNSVIIQLYIYFETEMTEIVSDKKENWDRKKTFFENTKRLLIDKIDISNLDEYSFLKNFAELRNAIVHNNSRLSSRNKNNTKRILALEKLNKIDGFDLKIDIYPEGKIYSFKIIDKAFLLISLKQIELFLDKIYTEITK